MTKKFKSSVLSAHDLAEGHAVFLGPDGWLRDIAHAVVAQTQEDAQNLESRAAEDVQGNLVIEPYLVEVSLDNGHPVPTARREQIRASGLPTTVTATAEFSAAA